MKSKRNTIVILAIIIFFLFVTPITDSFAASFERISAAERVKALLVASDGRVWASHGDYSPNATFYWDGKAWVNTNFTIEFSKLLERNGTIWGIPDYTSYLYYFNGYIWVQLSVAWPHGTERIRTGTIDQSGNIWVGGIDGRTAYWNGSFWVNTGMIPYGQTIEEMAVDSSNRVWVATSNGYLAYRSGSGWVGVGQASEFGGGVNLTIGHDGKVWLTEGGRVAYYYNSSWVNVGLWPYGHTDNRYNKSIYDIATGKDGKIWFGGEIGKVAYYDSGFGWVGLDYWPPGYDNDIFSFSVDSAGRVWMSGTGGYVRCYQDGRWISDSAHLTEIATAIMEDNIIDAKEAAEDAKVSAETASNRTWYSGTHGGSSGSVGDLAGYISNVQLPSLSTKVDTIADAFNLAPKVDVETVSGARATSGTHISAFVNVTDDGIGSFTYSINGGAYFNLPEDRVVNLPVSNAGNNFITIRVKDDVGNIGMDSISIRGL